ncbi:hypothetical protein F5Y16DRAFT_350352 [Xylariaceae sp. FL0255]|nr:hypothetical protein F5Y16DRAFT_350352 [Xylariaceae sp. FL0255]
MSEAQKAPESAQMGWAKLESDSGKDYNVKASDYDMNDEVKDKDSLNANGPSFQIDVNWTFPSSGSPDQEFQNKTGITWYKLDKAPWYSLKKYRLTIACKDTYNYSFTDKEPDTYWLNVWATSSTHTVEYDSRNPDIVKITGQ